MAVNTRDIVSKLNTTYGKNGLSFKMQALPNSDYYDLTVFRGKITVSTISFKSDIGKPEFWAQVKSWLVKIISKR